MSGYYKMHRGWMENPIFADEPFTERTAWIWLIENAAWKPRNYRVGNAVHSLGRGQLVASVRFLAEQWGWGKRRTEGYLTRLKNGDMISTDAGTGISVITICNYDKYQSTDGDEGTQRGQPGDTAGTARGHSGDKTEEGKKRKKEIGGAAKQTPRERAKAIDLPESIPRDNWCDWIDHRFEKDSKPPTQKAVGMWVKKLDGLARAGHPAAAVIAQSIERNWSGLFEVKGATVTPLRQEHISDEEWRFYMQTFEEIGEVGWPQGKLQGPYPGACPEHIKREFQQRRRA